MGGFVDATTMSYSILAAQPTKGCLVLRRRRWCTQSFSELGVSGGVCLFAVDEHQRSQSMCDLTIGNDHGW